MAGNKMDRKVFYESLIKGMLQSGFQLSSEALSRENVETDNDKTSSSVRKFIKYLPITINIAGEIFNLPIPTDFSSDLDPIFKKKDFRQDIESIYPLTITVFYKFQLAQPLIVPIIEGDDYSPEQFHDVTEKLFQIVLNFRKHSGFLKVKFGGKKIKNKMGAFGYIIYVFFESDKALNFVSRYQSKCKRRSLKNMCQVVPLGLDVHASKIYRHKGLPILKGTINLNKLEKHIFAKISCFGFLNSLYDIKKVVLRIIKIGKYAA